MPYGSGSTFTQMRQNRALQKNRNKFRSDKRDLYANTPTDTGEVELKLISKVVQDELNRQIKRENRNRRILDIVVFASGFTVAVGFLIWLLTTYKI